MNENNIKIINQNGNSREFAQSAYIKETWLNLQKQAEPSFFLTWDWMASWLYVIDQPITFLSASISTITDSSDKSNTMQTHDKAPYETQQIVACAFIGAQQTHNLRNMFFPNQYYLHRTGQAKLDQMWIEDNDFLLDTRFAERTRKHLYHYLVQQRIGSSFLVGISEKESVAKACESNKLVALPISESISYQKSLNPACADVETLISAFSKNTKHQLRRSIKLLTQNAPIALKVAGNHVEAKTWLKEAGTIHAELWAQTEFGSGFNNSYFTLFHERLIDTSFDARKIVVAKLMHGEQNIGYIYGFNHQNTFYFYLSALNKAENAKIKLGLVAHLYLMMHLAEKGVNTYDFMAGSARYKQSLSDHHKEMGFYRITRDNLVYKFDNALRQLKTSLTKKWHQK